MIMNHKHILATLCLILFPFTTFAQQLEGSLLNSKQEPVSYANIVVLALPDSTFLQGAVSDENGKFSVKTTPQGKVVRISAIGYTTQFLPVAGWKNKTIVLADDTQMLQELTVRGTLPHTQIKGDAFVTQIQGSVLERSEFVGTILRLISRVIQSSFLQKFLMGSPLGYFSFIKYYDFISVFNG